MVECLDLRGSGVLVAGHLFPNQVSAVVEEVGRQQETRKGEDEQADVDLEEDAYVRAKTQIDTGQADSVT